MSTGTATKKSRIEIHGTKGILVAIDPDTGEIEFGENYDFDETAKTFWRGIEQWKRDRATED